MQDASTVTTNRIAQNDAYASRFEAYVVSCTGNDLVLDRTAFFPEEGGQSCDTGEIEGVAVTDVQIRDGLVVHTLEKAVSFVPGVRVRGTIDWARRYDLMQQHSGEHLLSGLVHKRYGFDNVGFHLTPWEVTLDFNGKLPKEDLADLEREVNGIIRSNIPSEVFYLEGGSEEEQALSYRSKLALTGQIRLVRFGEADLCACCAPHVARSGEIGSLKILGMINWKNGVRLTIACGARAVEVFCREHDLLTKTARSLTTAAEEVPDRVAKLEERQRELAAKIRLQETALMGFALRDAYEAGPKDGTPVMLFLEEADTDAMLKAADAFANTYQTEVLLFAGPCGSAKNFLIAGPAAGADLQLLRTHFPVKGGGRGALVRGRIEAEEEEIRLLLTEGTKQ